MIFLHYSEICLIFKKKTGFAASGLRKATTLDDSIINQQLSRIKMEGKKIKLKF